jgi:hypothetical protein
MTRFLHISMMLSGWIIWVYAFTHIVIYFIRSFRDGIRRLNARKKIEASILTDFPVAWKCPKCHLVTYWVGTEMKPQYKEVTYVDR